MRKFLIVLFIIFYLPNQVNAIPPLAVSFFISLGLHLSLFTIVFKNKLGKTDKVGIVAVDEKKENEKLIEFEIVASNRISELTKEQVSDGTVKAFAKSMEAYSFPKQGNVPRYNSSQQLDEYTSGLKKYTDTSSSRTETYHGVPTYPDFDKKYGLPVTITHNGKVYVNGGQSYNMTYKNDKVIMVAECTVPGDECHNLLTRQGNGENIQSFNQSIEDVYELPNVYLDEYGRLILRVMLTVDVGNVQSKEYTDSNKKVSLYKTYVTNVGYLEAVFDEYDKALNVKKMLLVEPDKNPMKNAANVYVYLNETYEDYKNTYTAEQLRDLLRHLAVTNPSKISKLENSNLARSLNLSLSDERGFKHSDVEVQIEETEENYFGTSNSVPEGIDYQGILNEIMRSEMYQNAANAYSNSQNIDALSKELHDGINKLLAGIPNGSNISHSIANQAVGGILNSLKSGGFAEGLAGSLSGKLGGNGEGGGTGGDNETGTGDVVKAINALPDKIVGKNSDDSIIDPIFESTLDFDSDKKSIGSLFNRINIPLLETLKGTRLNLADFSSSVSVNVYGRDIEFSVSGYEEQLSYIGQLMVALATLTSIIYVFRRD